MTKNVDENVNVSSPSDPTIRPSDIIGINPIITGILVTVSCRQCGSQFEKLQSTVDTLAFGQYTCPGCQTVYNLWPEDFIAALDKFFPHCSGEQLSQIKEEGSRIARNWYRAGSLAELLMYKGVNLGEPTERVLLSYILNGLAKAHLAKQELK